MDEKTFAMAFSIQANPGVYAILLGSGVSRSAGIPTGWEIIQDLCSKLASLSGEKVEGYPSDWYTARFGKEPRYDDLLGMLAKTQEERRNLLSTYFVPTDEEREQGRKLPTPTHVAIAEMVKSGFIKLILTTNFDRLMETALEQVGFHDYTVISTDDSLKGARPIVHSPCTIVKLHGDWKDSRLRNTSGELAQYSPELNSFLDRAFDEFGLVISGWSAVWDQALKNAMLRSPSRRYSWYWLTVGELSEEAKDLVRHRDATVLQISGADSFFPALAVSISAMKDAHRKHPLSAKVAIETTKKLLVSSEFRIPLHDLVTDQVVKVAEFTDSQSVDSSGKTTWEDVHRQVEHYLNQTEILCGILATIGFFGQTQEHRAHLRRAVERLGHNKALSGLVALIGLRNLPVYLAMYSAGIGAVGADRFDNLRSVLIDATIPEQHGNKTFPAVTAITAYDVFENKAAVPIVNAANRHTPISEFMWTALRASALPYLPTQREYDVAFDVFEYLLALVYVDRFPDPYRAPIGRFGWRPDSHSILETFIAQVERLGANAPAVEFLFEGDPERFTKAKEVLKEVWTKRREHWW